MLKCISKVQSSKNVIMPEISVIIPVYNASNQLSKCLDSLLNQTFQDFEIICIDDCSKDKSLDILHSYQKKSRKIKVIALKKNRKQGGARNIGLDCANGKYVCFVDADDWVAEDALEKMYLAAQNHCPDLVISNIENVCANNSDELTRLKNKFDRVYKSFSKETGVYDFDFTTEDTRISFLGMLLRKSIIDENNIRFPENIIQEDITFHWVYMSCVKKICYLNESLYFRVLHEFSTMYQHTYNNYRVFDLIQNIKAIRTYFLKSKKYFLYKKKFSDRVREYINAINDSKIKTIFVLKTFLIMPEIILLYFANVKYQYRLKKLLKQNPQLILWGASNFLEGFLKKTPNICKNIIGIVDKSTEKKGGNLCGITIFSPEEIDSLNADKAVLTILNKNQKIYAELQKYLAKQHPNIKLLPNIFE